ncbi:hypothetical protein Lal_00015486 [Lupinus albus]|nr:hypothetical protein Lal_00015486 [Lupinus albus]
MNTLNPQSKELFGLGEIKVASAASNSLLGHNDPFYAPEEQTARLAKFACKNGVYQTMVKNIFIILDEDFLVDVGGLGRFDHPYGYFEEKLLSDFEPLRTYKTMLRDSQQNQATNKPTVSALAVEYKLMYTLLDYCLAPRDLRHDDPTECDGIWTYFEDVDFYPESTDLPPPENNSDEESVAPPV